MDITRPVEREGNGGKFYRAPLDLRVAAVKSTESTWPLQVKSFQFQVAAEIFHSSRRQILW